MKINFIFSIILFLVGFNQISFAQINIKVKVKSVSVSSSFDCDAGGSDNSDYVFEYKVQDNSPSTFSNNSPVAGSIGMCNYVILNENNGPFTLSPSSPGLAIFSPSNGVFFDRSYNCKSDVPSSFTLTWSAYENDDVVVPSITPIANGTITPQVNSYTVPNSSGTFTTQFTQTSTEGACPQTYFIEFELEKTVGSFSPLAIFSASGNTICTGATNGEIEVAVTGGSGTVLYDWSNDGLSDYDDNLELTSVSAGSYTLVVKDALNCTDTVSSSVFETDIPANISSFTVASPTVCAGQSAVAYAVPSQSNTIFVWNYNAAGTYMNGTGNAITIDFNSMANTGTLSVYAQNSCSVTPTLTMVVTVSPLPNVTINGNNLICQNTQQILTASGASSYTWNTGAQTSSVSVSSSVSSIYTVNASSASGCISAKQFTVDVLPTPTVQINASSLTVCPHQTVTAVAVGSGNLFIWSDGFIGASHTVSATATTVYTVTNTFTNSCFAQTTFTLNVSGTALSVAGNQTVCTAGVVSLTVTGAPTYSWSNGVSTSTNSFSPNSTTTVSVLGVDGAGCRDSLTLNIFVIDPPTVTITGLDTICEGQSVTLTANASNDVTGYTWNSGSISSSITVTPLATFTYVATVSNGVCSVSDNYQVYVRLIPTADFNIPSTPLCATEGVYTFTALPSGGNYSGISVIGNTFDPSIGVGVYPITYSVNVGNGCIASVTNSVEVMVCTGLSTYQNEVGLALYPNPAAGEVFLKSNKEMASIYVYDYFGKLVKMIEVNTLETKIDVSDLAKGLYSFTIAMNDRSQTIIKVVKE
jgi:hypothetical protein